MIQVKENRILKDQVYISTGGIAYKEIYAKLDTPARRKSISDCNIYFSKNPNEAKVKREKVEKVEVDIEKVHLAIDFLGLEVKKSVTLSTQAKELDSVGYRIVL